MARPTRKSPTSWISASARSKPTWRTCSRSWALRAGRKRSRSRRTVVSSASTEGNFTSLSCLHLVASAPFSTIEGAIGRSYEPLEIPVPGASWIKGRNANRHCGDEAPLAADLRLSGGDTNHEALGRPKRRFRRSVWRDNREFIPTPSRPEIRFTQSFADGVRDNSDHTIARGMPFAVVHLLETIDIDEEQ